MTTKTKQTIHPSLQRGKVSVLKSINSFEMVGNLWRHRELIEQLTRREVLNRYRGTYLGLLWAMATPLFMLLVYTFVFGIILKSRWGGGHRQKARLSLHSPYSVVFLCLIYSMKQWHSQRPR